MRMRFVQCGKRSYIKHRGKEDKEVPSEFGVEVENETSGLEASVNKPNNRGNHNDQMEFFDRIQNKGFNERNLERQQAISEGIGLNPTKPYQIRGEWVGDNVSWAEMDGPLREAVFEPILAARFSKSGKGSRAWAEKRGEFTKGNINEISAPD